MTTHVAPVTPPSRVPRRPGPRFLARPRRLRWRRLRGGRRLRRAGLLRRRPGRRCRCSSAPAATPRPRPSRTPPPPGRRRAATRSRSSWPTTSPSSSRRASPAATRRTCSTSTPASSATTPRPATSTPTSTRWPTPTTSTPTSSTRSPSTARPTARPRTSRRWRCRSTPSRGRRPASPTPTSPPPGTSCRRVAQELTTPDQAGLVLGIGRDRVGAFLVQNGGFWVDGETGEATATEPTNAEALEYVQGLLESGVAVLAPDVDAGWGGEAFGTQKAAMTIEGNWIRGAMEQRLPRRRLHRRRAAGGPGRQGHAALHAVLGHRRRLARTRRRPSPSSRR